MQERPLTTINQAGEDSAPVFEVEEPTDGQVLAYDGDSGKWKNADAGGGGAYIVHATWGDTPETEDTCTLDKTWNEITTAAQTGPVYIVGIYEGLAGTTVDAYGFAGTYINESIQGNTWVVNAFSVSGGVISDNTFSTDSADGYPAYTESNT